MFQDRHSNLYTSKTPRPALAPRQANGSTFTGHPGHDTYRMHTAKMAGDPQHTRSGLSFEMQCPISTRYLASQPNTAHAPARPNTPYFSRIPLGYAYAASVPLNEEQLRNKALQYVREYSRSPRKRKMANDIDEISGPVTILPDPHFKLTPLIEQACLLTSLLRVYPQSTDQKGLREDIAMLASIQNQHLADWLNFEVGQSRKMASSHTPRVSRNATILLDKPVSCSVTAEEAVEAERKRKQDEEVRGLLSAGATVWQDGSGLSVADVYSDGKASAAAEGQDEDVTTQEQVVTAAKSFMPLAAKASNTVPDVAIAASSQLSTKGPVEIMPRVVAAAPTTSISGVGPRARLLATPSPRVARVASSPVVRTSGRKRVAPARSRTESGVSSGN
ncbi:hypothetical protein N0V86_006729 [Didymella sp. IMI 355093]|nr:hypothetical protein N0V86_006729 [Didymella sp. IMI 355093]